MGGKPLSRLLGPYGLVLGTFLASGFYHSWALYAMGKGEDYSCVWFFALQAVAMVLERVWRSATGRRIEGWVGTAWVWFWIMGVGQVCSTFSEV